MRVLVAGEYRLFRGPDGDYYTTAVFDHHFWERYLTVFDRVTVVARTDTAADTSGMLPVTGHAVDVHALPHYVGLRGYIRRWLSLRRSIQELRQLDGALVLRAPGPIASLVRKSLRGTRPYAVEVVGDPHDVFAPGVVAHPLRPLIRWRATRDLKSLCKNAVAVGYVSRFKLPDRYPAAAAAGKFYYSSATMPPEAFVQGPRTYTSTLTDLVSIGSMDQMYKGFDLLIRALPTIQEVVPDVSLTIVGGGNYLPALEELARRTGVSDAVRFIGAVGTAEEVRGFLDAAQLYVSGSRTEGLPRSIIEAMARGLPCVSTDVGSTRELLDSSALCRANDVHGLAALCLQYMCDPRSATDLAERGWRLSARFSESRLAAERGALYLCLMQATEQSNDVDPSA